MSLARKYRTILGEAGINTPLRLSHFFAQLKHESNLKPISENLNYSAMALMDTFGKYFKTLEDAQYYARKREKIANRVYANRMENGDECSGDGWRYRGRGFIQTTGKRNYRLLSEATGIDFVSHPDKLLNEPDAMIAALFYWTTNNLNRYADADDINKLTKAINGGYHGLADRKKWLKKYKEIF